MENHSTQIAAKTDQATFENEVSRSLSNFQCTKPFCNLTNVHLNPTVLVGGGCEPLLNSSIDLHDRYSRTVSEQSLITSNRNKSSIEDIAIVVEPDETNFNLEFYSFNVLSPVKIDFGLGDTNSKMMEQTILTDMKNELEQIDMDSVKFDAIIQLKTWQRQMHTLIDQTYQDRLKEINAITSERDNQIEKLQHQIRSCDEIEHKTCQHVKDDIEALKSPITVMDSIPENFHLRIQRTVRIQSTLTKDKSQLIDDDEDDDDEDDDEPVIVDFDSDEHRVGERVTVVQAAAPAENRVAKVFYSQPVQHALAINLAKALTQIGTVAATTTTTAAATTMAKTAVIATACGIGTVAYGVGKLAMGATQTVWSFVFSTND